MSKSADDSLPKDEETDEPPYSEETFEDKDDDADGGESRPELQIPLRERKLVTQPFDFIVSSIEQQIKDGSLVLQDHFQRRRVWDDTKASRLIESLLLNVPIPVCYFAESEDGAYSVIDGQQRLTSIYRYLTNQFSLRGLRVRPEINRKRFVELDPSDQRLIRTRTIRCIALQKESNPDIRFDVFERLNSGSVKLTAQELRNSTYRGRLNALIRELCEDKLFQKLRGASGLDKRMRDAELILRFFAFHYAPSAYKGYFAPFLDNYLASGIRMSDVDIERHRTLFLETIQKVEDVFGDKAFRRFDKNGNAENQINRAIYDVIMLTFARIDKGALEGSKSELVRTFCEMCNNDKVFFDAIIQATRDKTRINNRLAQWIYNLRQLGIHCPDIVFG
ncbi:MAG: DUF262 domain-containing protein [Rhodospirillales bacterium]|nr:DUF262 domain-containing protein [Rhodospirillales bacterium]